MRFNIVVKGGYSSGILGLGGGELNSRLALFRNPVLELETATKNYADSSVRNINGETFGSGMLADHVIPGFTEDGDVLKEDGISVLTLSDMDIIQSQYTKYTVDNKGRITGVGFIEDVDLPILPWEKVNESIPSTLAGYGIADAIHITGGTLSNKISIPELGGLSKSLVNKIYVDVTLEEVMKPLPVGTILVSSSPTTREGYLRCNGAELSVLEYSELYSIIGDQFTTTVTGAHFNIPDIVNIEGVYSYIKF